MEVGAASLAIDAADVGGRVAVKGYPCAGTLRFFGPHALEGTTRCGVELDEPVGNNNGTIKGHLYFIAGEGRGVLVKPAKVTRADPSGSLDVSPAYGTSSQFRSGSSKSGGSSSVVHETVSSADAMYMGAGNGFGASTDVSSSLMLSLRDRSILLSVMYFIRVTSWAIASGNSSCPSVAMTARRASRPSRVLAESGATGAG